MAKKKSGDSEPKAVSWDEAVKDGGKNLPSGIRIESPYGRSQVDAGNLEIVDDGDGDGKQAAGGGGATNTGGAAKGGADGGDTNTGSSAGAATRGGARDQDATWRARHGS